MEPFDTLLSLTGYAVHAFTLLCMPIAAAVVAMRDTPGAPLRAGLLAFAALLHGMQMASNILAFELPTTLFDVFDGVLSFDLVIWGFDAAMTSLAGVKWVLLTAAVFVGRSAAAGRADG